MTDRPGASALRSPARWLLALGLVGVSVTVPGTAHAFWTEGAVGSGTAPAATLPDIEVTAVSPQHSSRVEVAWAAAELPPGMVLEGYRVQRLTATGVLDACGTSVGAPAPAGTPSPLDPHENRHSSR